MVKEIVTSLTGTKTRALGLSVNSLAFGLRLDFFIESDILSIESPDLSSTGVASRTLDAGGVTTAGALLTSAGLTTGERLGCTGAAGCAGRAG